MLGGQRLNDWTDSSFVACRCQEAGNHLEVVQSPTAKTKMTVKQPLASAVQSR